MSGILKVIRIHSHLAYGQEFSSKGESQQENIYYNRKVIKKRLQNSYKKESKKSLKNVIEKNLKYTF